MITEFNPSIEELKLINEAVVQEVIKATGRLDIDAVNFIKSKLLFISKITNPKQDLKKIIKKYGDTNAYAISFEDHQAYSVLRHSNLSREIVHLPGFPNSCSLFNIQIRSSKKRNPDDQPSDLLKKVKKDINEAKKKDAENGRAKKIYDNWRKAWWREVLQNSVDACRAVNRSSHEISIVLIESEKPIKIQEAGKSLEVEAVQVLVRDTGIGMSLDSLTKFLSPGGSTKKGVVGSAGGLGRAKDLIYFSCPIWSIETKKDEDHAYKASGKYSADLSGVDEDSYGLKSIELFPEKTKPGTNLAVVMKRSESVNKEDLIEILERSFFPGITIKFQHKKRKIDGSIEVVEEKTLEANNDIYEKEFIRSFDRSNGSVWAKVYYRKKEKDEKKRKIIVRVNGLYLYTINEDLKKSSIEEGKIIIELVYSPKGKKWKDNSWVDMSEQEAQLQTEDHYGPSELLPESREKLKPWYSSILDTFLTRMRTNKEELKKKRTPRRKELIGNPEIKKNYAELMAIVDTSNKDIKNITDGVKKFKQIEAIKLIKEGIYNGEYATNNPESFKVLPDDVKEILKTSKEELKEAFPDFTDDLLDILGNLPLVTVDTSADPEFYKSIMEDIVEASKNFSINNYNHTEFREKIAKMLAWTPKFGIWESYDSDSTPSAPQQFLPKELGSRQKRIAKFWIECVRLVHMICGYSSPNLNTGFLFRDDDNILGFYEEGDNGPIVYISPCKLDKGSWEPRYDKNKLGYIVSIAFHEVGHVVSDDHEVHGETMANQLTNYISLVFDYSTLFRKLWGNIEDQIKVHGAVKNIKTTPTPGFGFYSLSKGTKGARAKFTTFKEVVEEAEALQEADYSIFAKYWPKTGEQTELPDPVLKRKYYKVCRNSSCGLCISYPTEYYNVPAITKLQERDREYCKNCMESLELRHEYVYMDKSRHLYLDIDDAKYQLYKKWDSIKESDENSEDIWRKRNPNIRRLGRNY